MRKRDCVKRVLVYLYKTYDIFKKWKQNWAILAPGNVCNKYITDSDESKLACVSPFVENFQDLYSKET